MARPGTGEPDQPADDRSDDRPADRTGRQPGRHSSANRVADEVFGDVIPERTRDELPAGWGESDPETDDWYLRERPPHHG